MTTVTERNEVVIVAGSNLDRDRCMPAAIRRLRRHPDIEVRPDGAPPFYNAAVLASTALDPEELRDELRGIEADLGRVRTEDRYAPRTIDLDVTYYGDLAKDFDEWSIPDPDAETFAHVAVPAAEVAPHWTHPA